MVWGIFLCRVDAVGTEQFILESVSNFFAYCLAFLTPLMYLAYLNYISSALQCLHPSHAPCGLYLRRSCSCFHRNGYQSVAEHHSIEGP